jgi:regulator of sigma E protease
LRNFIVGHGNDTLLVTVLRAKENKILSVVPEVVSESSYPTIGVALDMVGTLKLPLHKALIEGAQLTASITWGTIKSFGMLITGAFTGKASINDVTGPVGIVGVVGDAARFGFVYLLSFTALISINLAVINLVPFPALDGGRLLFLLIEKIKGSRISPKIANTANAIGFALLIILMLVITYHDIAKLL